MAATVASAVRWWARTAGDRPAIVVDDDTLTYRELHDWTGRVARRLADAGVKPGDRVGLFAPNCLHWPLAALAVLRSGAVLVPLNSRLRPAEVRKVADDAGISAMFAPASHRDIAAEASDA